MAPLSEGSAESPAGGSVRHSPPRNQGNHRSAERASRGCHHALFQNKKPSLAAHCASSQCSTRPRKGIFVSSKADDSRNGGSNQPASFSELPTESRQMYQIAVWNSLHRLTRFAPSCQAAHDDKSVEPLLSQQICHTGARGFAQSSTVQVEILIPGKPRHFL